MSFSESINQHGGKLIYSVLVLAVCWLASQLMQGKEDLQTVSQKMVALEKSSSDRYSGTEAIRTLERQIDVDRSQNEKLFIMHGQIMYLAGLARAEELRP